MLGVAIVIGLVVVAVAGAMLTLALRGWSTERRAGEEAKGRAELAVRLEVASANTKTEAARADFEKGRADALDAAIVAAVAAGPVDGSYERLLQARHGAGASSAGRGDAAEVRDEGDAGQPAATLGPDDLLPP